jgi:hypothetical protein
MFPWGHGALLGWLHRLATESCPLPAPCRPQAVVESRPDTGGLQSPRRVRERVLGGVVSPARPDYLRDMLESESDGAAAHNTGARSGAATVTTGRPIAGAGRVAACRHARQARGGTTCCTCPRVCVRHPNHPPVDCSGARERTLPLPVTFKPCPPQPKGWLRP